MRLRIGDDPGITTLRLLKRDGGWTGYAPVCHALLADGVALAPSAYEAGPLSLAHEPASLMGLRDALPRALARPTGHA